MATSLFSRNLSRNASGEYDMPFEEESLSSTASTSQIICYLDFDGTLTQLKGEPTISSDLYTMLCTAVKVDISNYHLVQFKNAEEIKSILAEKLSANQAMQITPQAALFLKEMDEQQAEIVIISRNRREYIESILKYAGINLKKIKIYDCNGYTVDKGNALNVHERYLMPSQDRIVVVVDDSTEDFESMKTAANSKYSASNVIAKKCAVGNFPAAEILQEIKQKLEPQNTAGSMLAMSFTS